MEFLKFKRIGPITPAMQIACMLSAFVLLAILGRDSVEYTGLLFGRPTSAYFATFFAPVYEEVLFRGVILSVLLSRFKPWKAIVFSALLFGLWHLKNIVYMDMSSLVHQMCYTGLVFGPLMAWITYKTKTIWLAACLHYLNNALLLGLMCMHL